MSFVIELEPFVGGIYAEFPNGSEEREQCSKERIVQIGRCV